MRDRTKEIKAKGFSIVQGKLDTDYQQRNTGYQGSSTENLTDYSKIKVGTKTLEDAVYNLGTFKKSNPRLGDKAAILRAIDENDYAFLREVSDYFYKTSGIYARILRYMAFMYRYDWYVTPYKNDSKVTDEKLLDGFNKALMILDNYNVKKHLGEIALKVLRHGVFYGYKVPLENSFVLQELDPNYCRTRFNKGIDTPVVEFNMKFFDDYFRDTAQRMRILKIFPAEFSKGYVLYKQGKLVPDFSGDTNGWYMLEPDNTVRFTANGEEYPAFISAIPLIIDLDEAQELDRKRALQRLLKIVIQKIPIDKQGEFMLDVDEARQLHNNAVQMLTRAIGLDVLTTFADVSVEDLTSNSANSAESDDLERAERQVYNDMGVSQLQFNSTGNIALNNSILNDESTMYNLLLQFETFLNDLIASCNKNKKKVIYRVQLLTTTIYNYKELAKLYKEQVQLGYSKMLPQIAMGQSQSSILANAHFENEILDLVNVFIPPVMSSTMNADILNKGGGDKNANQKNQGASGNQKAVNADPKPAGRKELDDSQKSEKTLQNKESQS